LDISTLAAGGAKSIYWSNETLMVWIDLWIGSGKSMSHLHPFHLPEKKILISHSAGTQHIKAKPYKPYQTCSAVNLRGRPHELSNTVSVCNEYNVE
jgi:hypothetical protein